MHKKLGTVKWNSQENDLNEKSVFTVVIWQDSTGFGAHRIAIRFPVLIVHLAAKNERAAFNRAVNEFVQHCPNLPRGRVTVINGFRPVKPHKDAVTLTLHDTF